MQSEPQAPHYLGGSEFSHSVDPKQGLPKTGLEGYGICLELILHCPCWVTSEGRSD